MSEASLDPSAARGALSLRDRWRAFRNARLADTRFQRWAAKFPLTRPTAQKNARALFDVTAGFVYSQILFACVKLKLFQVLEDARCRWRRWPRGLIWRPTQRSGWRARRRRWG